VLALVVVGGGAALLLLGGDERSEDEQAYVDAIAAYTESQQSEELSFDAEQSRCFAEAIVDAVGVDSLRDVATPEEIRTSEEEDPLDAMEVSRGQAEAVYDDANGCVDFRQVFLDSARQNGVTDSQLECLEGALSEDLVREYLVATFDEDEQDLEAADQALGEAAAPCEDA
jgi:hypothetical protein